MKFYIDNQSRADLLASQTLGRNSDEIKAFLRERSIVIGINRRQAATRLGQIAVITAVNILARMGPLAPRIYLDIPEGIDVLPNMPLLPAGEKLRKSIRDFTWALAAVQNDHPIRDYARPGNAYDLGLFVGSQSAKSSKAVTLGSNNWHAVVNPSGNRERLRDCGNPLGIILAASLGSTEIIKHLWLPIKDNELLIEPLDKRTTVSSFDFSVNNPKAANPSLPKNIYLGHAVIIGLGAIGSACNYILSALKEAQLSLDMVDNDIIERSNEERLFTSSKPDKDIRTPKVIHAQQYMKTLNAKTHVFAYKMNFERFVELSRDRLGYVFCCLDNVNSRRVLQTELASVLVNGGTDLTKYMISLHDFDVPQNACLLDLYTKDPTPQRDLRKDLCSLLRISYKELDRLVSDRRRIDAQIIIKAQRLEANPVKRKVIARYTGLTVEQALARVCSSASPNKVLPSATISFVSLTPAVFMAADFIKRRTLDWKLKAGDPNFFQVDSFKSPEKRTFINMLASRYCFCQSKIYREAFTKRQRLRKPYLEKIFSSAANGNQKAQNLFPRPNRQLSRDYRRRVVNHERSASVNNINDVIPAHYPTLRQFILAAFIYSAGVLTIIYLLFLFLQFESKAKSFYDVREIISSAFLAGKTFSGWLKISMASGIVIFAYQPLLKTATKIMKNPGFQKSLKIEEKEISNIKSKILHKLLCAFFIMTSLPVVVTGYLLFFVVNINAFITCCKKANEIICCAVIPLYLFFFYLVFIVGALGFANLFHNIKSRCAWTLNLPHKP